MVGYKCIVPVKNIKLPFTLTGLICVKREEVNVYGACKQHQAALRRD